jgi:hypothetical protein
VDSCSNRQKQVANPTPKFKFYSKVAENVYCKQSHKDIGNPVDNQVEEQEFF